MINWINEYVKSATSSETFRTNTTNYNIIINNIFNNPPCDQIVSGLFLGMMPLNSATIATPNNTPDKIIEYINKINPTLPLRLVISVQEKDAIQGVGFKGINVVSDEKWSQKDIKRIPLYMDDFEYESSVNLNEAVKIIFEIRKCIISGSSVLVHCKAGRSRSAMIVMAYIMLFIRNPLTGTYYTTDEAKKLLKSKRDVVSLLGGKTKKGEEIVNYALSNNLLESHTFFKEQNHDNTSVAMSFKNVCEELRLRPEHVSYILTLPSTISAVKQLSTFIDLDNYQAELIRKKTIVCKRANLIDYLKNLMALPHSEHWFFACFDIRGPLENLLDSQPEALISEIDIVTSDRHNRTKLVKNFRQQLLQFLQSLVSITHPDINLESIIQHAKRPPIGNLFYETHLRFTRKEILVGNRDEQLNDFVNLINNLSAILIGNNYFSSDLCSKDIMYLIKTKIENYLANLKEYPVAKLTNFFDWRKDVYFSYRNKIINCKDIDTLVGELTEYLNWVKMYYNNEQPPIHSHAEIANAIHLHNPSFEFVNTNHYRFR